LRLPRHRDLFANSAKCRPFLTGGQRGVEAPHQQPADGLLFLEQRPPRGFGGMSREDRLESQLLEQPVHSGGGETRGREPPQRVFETALLRGRPRSRAGSAQVVAAPANAMDTLGEIYYFEICGEGVDQLASGFGAERADGGLK